MCESSHYRQREAVLIRHKAGRDVTRHGNILICMQMGARMQKHTIKHTTTGAGQSGMMGLSPMRVAMCQQISQTVEVKIVRSQLDIKLTGELFDILALFCTSNVA